ncbi:hypothetical protein BRC89_11210 [Halobacteriales archaeon QS_4_70_19]|nr:MAG: hypothetical protein BRC89_11210 [Halobacteriales archaeon QS_4_70_19]
MSGSAPGRREVAYRVFAAEFDDATVAYSESDEERAPNYVVTPTGARANRLFAVGVLTAVEDVNPEMVRGRVVDPTGPFVSYAGQYQPDALAFLERADPPTFVALTGKARTFEPDDGDAVYSSVRPESVNAVDAATRDRWVVTAAERTLTRIGVVAAALEAEPTGDRLRAALEEAGVDERLADGVALALAHYGTTPAYLDALHDLSLDAARVVANERDEAGSLDLAPDEGGEADLAALEAGDVPTVAAGGESTDDGTATTTETTADEVTADTGASTTEATGAAEAATETGATDGTTAGSTADEGAATGSAATGEQSTAQEPAAAEAETTTEESPTSDSTVSTAEPTESTEDADDLGEFESGEFDAEEPDEDPLGEDVREEVEEEYGTEFSTGTEVESEPELEPDPEPDDEPASDAASEPEATDTEPESGPETTAEEPADDDAAADAEAASEGPAEDVDLETAVMDAMQDLDDGDGAPTDEVIDQVVDRTGASADEVDAAVQDALMGGQCYEPEDGRLKPI